MAEPKFSDGPWECVAAEFGEGENEGLVGFWVRMPQPSLGKRDGDLIEAALPMYAALEAVIIRGCGCYAVTDENYHSDKCPIPQVIAALAKASGEAQ